MCGIGGIVRIGNRKIRKWQLQELACELQHRGTDATGFVVTDDDGRINTWKQPGPAWKVVVEPGFHKWCDKVLTDKTRILLVHTRAFTKGSPQINENNHPLFAHPDIQGVVIHNGMVRNDVELFTKNAALPGFKRSCSTDSDAFRAVLDNYGAIDKGLIDRMRLVEGTAAVAAVHINSPGKLLLLRDNNPLVIAGTADMLAFASTKEALHKVLKPYIKLHNVPMQVHAPDLSFTAMPNETGYIIDVNANPPGLVAHDVFKCTGQRYGGNVKYVKGTNFYQKQEAARLAAIGEKRYRPEPAPAAASSHDGYSNGHGKTKILVDFVGEVAKDKTSDKTSDADSPALFQYVICPGAQCNRHVEILPEHRKYATLAYLACKNCGTNLASAPDASIHVN